MADAIVIGKDKVMIAGRSFQPEERLENRLLWKMHRAAGSEYLPWPPGEKGTARQVARALRRLGIQALRDCLDGEEIIQGGEHEQKE
jgi:hypothetical protein